MSEEFITTKDAARLLHHNIFWICRKSNRIRYGIKLYKMGGKNLFKRSEILALIQSKAEKKPGRPRKRAYVEMLDQS